MCRYSRKGRNKIRLKQLKNRQTGLKDRQERFKNRQTGSKSRQEAHKKGPEKRAVLLTGILMILVILAVLAVIRGGDIPGNYDGRIPGTEKNVEMEESAETAETKEAEAQIPLPVNEKEEALLRSLYRAMEKKEPDQAARILNSQEDLLKTLVQETLDGKKYLYWQEEAEGELTGYMEEMTGETKGRGLAVTRFNTVFFGEFSGGKPEGDCAAVQAMVLAEPRFTYADGEWKNGKMNGHGKTGYRYYENAPETGFVMAEKEGRYQENLLEGDFTYIAENAGGEQLCWDMQAKNGVTVLSEKWVRHKNNGTYMLPSKEDSGRAYVLSESQAETIMWNNLIVWDEQ